MRTHHLIIIALVIVIGFGAKQFFFPPVKAEADINPIGMNVLQMQHGMDTQNLPVQKMHDMTFAVDSE